MTPNDALALIEYLCDANAEKWKDDTQANLIEVDVLRGVLAQVQPRYWLPSMVNDMAAAYKEGDMGAVHQIIDRMIFRDSMEQSP